MLELKDHYLHADADILDELVKPLSTDGAAEEAIKSWFSTSSELCQEVNAWLHADSSQRPALANKIFELLKAAEEALASQACLAGSEVTAADVAYAAALAGFYKAVRSHCRKRCHAGCHEWTANSPCLTMQAFTPDVEAKFPKLKSLLSGIYADDKLKAVWGSVDCPAATADTSTEIEAFLTAVTPKWTTARTRAAFIEVQLTRAAHHIIIL